MVDYYDLSRQINLHAIRILSLIYGKYPFEQAFNFLRPNSSIIVLLNLCRASEVLINLIKLALPYWLTCVLHLWWCEDFKKFRLLLDSVGGVNSYVLGCLLLLCLLKGELRHLALMCVDTLIQIYPIYKMNLVYNFRL